MTVRNAASMGTYGSTWQARGYAGQGNVADLIGSVTGRPAIIAGNGAWVFDQVLAAQAVYPDAVIFAVNEVGMYLPKVDHWVSLHPDNLYAWKNVRWLHPREQEFTKYHSDSQRAWLDYCWQQLTPQMCLSGYFAMQIAWVMGADRIVLCGCPGDTTCRFFEAVPRHRENQDGFGYGSNPQGNDSSVRDQVTKEMDRLPDFKAAVRSMSGWSKTFFGGLDDGSLYNLCGSGSPGLRETR